MTVLPISFDKRISSAIGFSSKSFINTCSGSFFILDSVFKYSSDGSFEFDSFSFGVGFRGGGCKKNHVGL